MHPTVTRLLVRNCLRDAPPVDYVRPSAWKVVREVLIACCVLPLLWLVSVLMGDPRE